jgi:hypothetical protein
MGHLIGRVESVMRHWRLKLTHLQRSCLKVGVGVGVGVGVDVDVVGESWLQIEHFGLRGRGFENDLVAVSHQKEMSQDQCQVR